MNYDLSEEEKAIVKRITSLAASEVGLNHQTDTLSDNPAQVRRALLPWASALVRAGYLNPCLTRPDGPGVGFVCAQEALAALAPSVYWSLEMGLAVIARLLTAYGHGWQRDFLLPQFTEGRLLGGLAVCEGHQSLDANALQTVAVPDGEDFRLSGVKPQVINASVADWLVVAAMAPEGPGLFLLSAEASGLKISPRLPTLSFRGTPVADLTLEGCLIPAEQALAIERGPQAIAALRFWEDQALTAAGLGIMQRSLIAARKHAKEHQSAGRPIIAYQEIGFKLAEMLTLFQTAQLLAQRAAWLAKINDREAAVTAVCAKVFCTEAAETVASQAMQVLGSRGLIAGNPVEEGYRDAKQLQIWGTSSEIARVKIGDLVLQFY